MRYRRTNIPEATYFFTINLAERKSALLTQEINKLRFAFNRVKKMHPFQIDAIVIMPDHLHMIMTLPTEDTHYSKRLALIKGQFSRQIKLKEHISVSRIKKRERGIWQRRFWEHVIRDEYDYENHLNYIHYNPVKHGHVEKPTDWKYSSIHQHIANGSIPPDWSCTPDFKMREF